MALYRNWKWQPTVATESALDFVGNFSPHEASKIHSQAVDIGGVAYGRYNHSYGAYSERRDVKKGFCRIENYSPTTL